MKRHETKQKIKDWLQVGIWVAVLGLGAVTPAFAAQEASVGAIFLNEAVGPRPAAMGEAFTAVGEDVNAVYWNPAGLARLTSINLMFAHTLFLQGYADEYLAFDLPLSRQDTIGLNALFSYIRSLEKTTLDSSEVSDFNAYDAYLGLSWSHAFSPMYAAGVTVKGIQQSIDTYTGSSVACDLGVLARGWIPDLNVGATLRNVGAPMKFKEHGYALPLAMDLGGAYRFWKKSILWTLDLSLPYQSDLSVKTGCEYNFEDMLFLRAGYRYSAATSSLGALAGITAGLGFTISDYTLDYAYSPYGVLGDVHRIALTFPFGRSSVDEEKIIQRMETNIRLRQENMIRECLKAGTRALEKNEFAEAQANFEKIHGLNPEYPGIKKMLERAAQGLAKQKADIHFSAGMKAFKQEEFLVALVEWTKVSETYPAYPEIKKWMDAVNQKLVQPEHSSGWTSQGETGRLAAKMELVVARGLDLLKAGQYARALDTWQEGLKTDPANTTLKSLVQKTRMQMQNEINTMLQDAREAWQAEKWVEAVRLWRRILRIDANQTQALQQLEVNQMKIRLVANDLYVKGVNNYVQNRWNDAIQNWKDLLVLDPENQKAKKHMESIERKIEEMQTL